MIIYQYNVGQVIDLEYDLSVVLDSGQNQGTVITESLMRCLNIWHQ